MEENPSIIELDLYIEPGESTTELAGQMANASGREIEYEVVEVFGPTGWPVVRFTGPRGQLESMLVEHGFEDGIDTYEV